MGPTVSSGRTSPVLKSHSATHLGGSIGAPPSHGACNRCKGTHLECTECLNAVAAKKGYDVSKGVKDKLWELRAIDSALRTANGDHTQDQFISHTVEYKTSPPLTKMVRLGWDTLEKVPFPRPAANSHAESRGAQTATRTPTWRCASQRLFHCIASSGSQLSQAGPCVGPCQTSSSACHLRGA